MNRAMLLTELKKYKKLNQAKYGILSLGIFGSYARNQATDLSDIDIVVKTESPNPFNLVHIKEELEKELKLPVDIVRLRENMNSFLKKHITNEAVYV